MQTDAAGAFVLNGVPIGEQVIEATDGPSKGSIKVTIEACKAASCQVVLN